MFAKYKEAWNDCVAKLIPIAPDEYEIADAIDHGIPGMEEAMAALKLKSHGARLMHAIEKYHSGRRAASIDAAGTSRAAGNV